MGRCFFDILKVGGPSPAFSPLQSVLTISIFTHIAGEFRHRDPFAGYGIGGAAWNSC